MSFEVAKLFCIVGGFIVLISGVYYFALSRAAIGLGAIVIAGQVRHLLWSAILVVLGVIAYEFEGGGSLWIFGPLLVIAAGTIGANHPRAMTLRPLRPVEPPYHFSTV